MITADLDIRNGVIGVLQNKKNAEYLIVEAIKDIVKASIKEGHLNATLEKMIENAAYDIECNVIDSLHYKAENICNEYMAYYFSSDEFVNDVLVPVIKNTLK